ncbi:MAG: bifunctional glutamate N-acetyltransferase/amino-acid acetyltransferase ArgJ [Betaproteobacteria bacterium]|nr:bifunctional glutamate N-acetyltransferase/amino-acid acetyltransferase ArgJ [Betaproteobacteria bacterium]
MAVNLLPPDPVSLLPVAGVELGFAEAGIRKANRRDLMLMRLAPGSRIAGVFTQNSFAAAPVQICRRHLAASAADGYRALIVNAGNANCGTGEIGLAAAQKTCELVAGALGCKVEAVLPFSTGVILEHLPVDRIEAALPRCIATLDSANWAAAAGAIMTTDTVAKALSCTVEIGGARVAVTGMAKGVGMLAPNMATMLAFIATDAEVAAPLLTAMVRSVADASFNRVTVDGDTSTNDSFVLIATGKSGAPAIVSIDDANFAVLQRAVLEVASGLARSIARDGEGATKFISIHVKGAADGVEAARVARRVADSPLVKTAFFASDPNLGRLLVAIGNAGIADLDVTRVELHLGEVKVIERGGRAADYREEAAASVMREAEIDVHIELGRGAGEATVWTCDFSYDYVKINAEYRT